MWSGELIIELAPRLALQAGSVTTEHNNFMKTHYSEGIYTLERKKEPQRDIIKLKLKKSEAKALFTLFSQLGFDSINLDKYPFNV